MQEKTPLFSTVTVAQCEGRLLHSEGKSVVKQKQQHSTDTAVEGNNPEINPVEIGKLANIAQIVEIMEETHKQKDWLADQIRQKRQKIAITPALSTVGILKMCSVEVISNLLSSLQSKEKFDIDITIPPITKEYHWFFTDIVAASDPTKTTMDQARKIILLNRLIELTDSFKQRDSETTLVLPTGDGMAIGFDDSPNNNDQSTGSSTSMPPGQSVSSIIDIEELEQDVGLLFDNVVTGGTVSVLAKDPSDLANLFDSVQNEGASPSSSSSPSQGLLMIYGTNSTTIGNVYDIDTSSGFLYEGDVYVTLPYDESLVLQSGASESDVGLLLYNGSQWEDRTVSVDDANNTVTGQLSSLSPVVAAVIEDGTFDALYLQVHPLDGVVVEDASFLAPQAGAAIGQAIDAGAAVKNLHRADQSYAFVVQIEDENGQAVYIDWLAGSLLRGETKEIGSNWTPNNAGTYSATILILDQDPASPESANPIAQKTSITTLHVTGLVDANGINGEQG